MSKTISIGELEAKERAMTPGEWHWDSIEDRVHATPNESWVTHPDGYRQLIVSSGTSILDGAPCGDMNSHLMCDPADANGLVALRNAAPALIAIAKAALASRQPITGEQGARDHYAACRALDEALKAVTP